jgi:hypothetical protein
MPGKSRQRKGKFRQQSKNKKGRRIPQVDISRKEIIPSVEEVTTITEVAVSSPVIEMQNIAKKPELFFELRRIGIFASMMLVTLILLVLFLD